MKIKTIKHYFKTLLIAILGRNPYRLELEQVRSEYAKTAENVELLRDAYYICKEKEEKANQQIASLQNLVELLRERIRENYDIIDKLQKGAEE